MGDFDDYWQESGILALGLYWFKWNRLLFPPVFAAFGAKGEFYIWWCLLLVYFVVIVSILTNFNMFVRWRKDCSARGLNAVKWQCDYWLRTAYWLNLKISLYSTLAAVFFLLQHVNKTILQVFLFSWTIHVRHLRLSHFLDMSLGYDLPKILLIHAKPRKNWTYTCMHLTSTRESK